MIKYIPEEAIPLVEYLIIEHKINLKIVSERQTKHGDFRRLPNGHMQITVNNNLNPYQFLLTLIHEIAHHVTYQKFGRVQPHGKEWKTVFQHLREQLATPQTGTDFLSSSRPVGLNRSVAQLSDDFPSSLWHVRDERRPTQRGYLWAAKDTFA